MILKTDGKKVLDSYTIWIHSERLDYIIIIKPEEHGQESNRNPMFLFS
jgi:hypothetical protein